MDARRFNNKTIQRLTIDGGTAVFATTDGDLTLTPSGAEGVDYEVADVAWQKKDGDDYVFSDSPVKSVEFTQAPLQQLGSDETQVHSAACLIVYLDDPDEDDFLSITWRSKTPDESEIKVVVS